MLMTTAECLHRATEFDDSPELAEMLREIAAEAAPNERYYLLESVQNLLGMHALIRSMTTRLRQHTAETVHAPQLGNAAVPRPTKLPVASEHGQLLDLARVLAIAGIGRTVWLESVRKGTAPRPIRIGQRTFWLEQDVKDWLTQRINESRGG